MISLITITYNNLPFLNGVSENEQEQQQQSENYIDDVYFPPNVFARVGVILGVIQGC